MPKYYRVNLKNKENNIIYPNVHNKWTFSTDGSLNVSNGSITLQNGNIYLSGIASNTPNSATKLVFGNNTTQYMVLRVNTNKSLVISESLTDNTNAIEFEPITPSFKPVNNNRVSLGTSTNIWNTIYVGVGSFYNDITRKVSEVDASLSNNNISTVMHPTTFNIVDKSSRIISRQECIVRSNGNIESYWYVRNYKTDGTMIAQKGILMMMNKSGILTYGVSDPDNFRSAISAVNKAGDTMTDSLTIQKRTSATVTYADKQNPRINFLNVDGSQAVSLIFTDYDTYKTPYGLTLIGNGQSTANGGAYLKVEGDIQSNTITSPKINSSLTTGTHINGNKGSAIINSTAANTGGYTMLARMKSRNGVWTFGAWDTSFDLFYTADSVISAGTNTYTKKVKFLDENGNSSFPGTINGYTLRAACSKNLLNRNSTGDSAWTNQTDGESAVPTKAFIAYWNGAYSGTNSNLSVCSRGYMVGSQDNSTRHLRAGALSTWNSNYSSYSNGTVMFCW